MKHLVEDHIRASRAGIAEGAILDSSFFAMNAFAAVIATYGLLLDSVAVVIGAMIVAVLLGSIMGIALALVDGDDRLLISSLMALGTGTALVFGLAFTIGAIHIQLPLTPEILARTTPNLMDLIVALAGGAAGAFATVGKKLGVGIVGAAIATALVPPLAASGICLAPGKLDLALGAFLLFFANLVAIQFAASTVLWVRGFHRISADLLHPVRLIRRGLVPAVLLLALVVGLGLNLRAAASKTKLSQQIARCSGRTCGEIPRSPGLGSGCANARRKERRVRNCEESVLLHARICSLAGDCASDERQPPH